MEKKSTYILSLIFLVMGLSFLVNSQANITGAVIGVSTTPSEAGFFAGASLVLVSFILFAVSIGGLEKKIKVINHIGSVKSLKKLSEKARKNQDVARDLNKLHSQLDRGYFQGGIGGKPLSGMNGIYELRTRKGARLYFRRIDETHYEEIAESSKQNQDKVIKELREIYH